MKKIISVLLAIVTVISLVSCNKEESYDNSISESTLDLKYYNPTFFLYEYKENEENKRINDGTEPSKKQKEICNMVIDEVYKKYKITKERPKVMCMNDEFFHITESLTGTAKYDKDSNCILIPESFDENCKSYLAHEILHYVSDCCKETIGLEYFVKDGRFLIGKALDEGICNYYSTKVFNHPKGTCIYEYETHVASLLALTFGDEQFFNAYTTGDWKSIKDFFNDSLRGVYFEEYFENLKLTPFEILQITLDEYQFLLSFADEMINDYGFEQWKDNFSMDINSMEEMLINVAKRVGKHEEAKKQTEKFIENCSGRIDFKGLTQIDEIAA